MAASIHAIDQTTPTGYDPTSSQGVDGDSSSEVSKEMFLQLLVAQIKNQNPLSPMDGTEFVSQLAEFTNLEQLIALGDDVEAIREALLADPAGTEENPKV